VSSLFIPLEDAARYAMSRNVFGTTPASLVLSFSTITHSDRPLRELVLLQNGNLMASCFGRPSRSRKYFRISFPEDATSLEYRGPTVASSANSDLFRMLCHFSEQLLHMRCSAAPRSIEELQNNASFPIFVVIFIVLSFLLLLYVPCPIH
jgi:hypothetical protein